MVQNKLAARYTLKKKERLYLNKSIELLFADSKSVANYPIRAVWRVNSPAEYPVSAGFSVSKRLFKHAVKRNKIKRLLRESYRLNKYILYDVIEKETYSVDVMFIYLSKEIPTFEKLDKHMKLVLSSSSAKIYKDNTRNKADI